MLNAMMVFIFRHVECYNGFHFPSCIQHDEASDYTLYNEIDRPNYHI